MLSRSLRETPQFDYANKLKIDLSCIDSQFEREKMYSLIFKRHADHKVRSIPHIVKIIPAQYECMVRAYSQLSMVLFAILKNHRWFKNNVSLLVIKNIRDMLDYIAAAMNNEYFCNDMLVLSYSILGLAQPDK
jgi:hypothetical protein